MDTPLNREQAITNLQRYLRRLSYEGLEGNRVPIDGIFDTATRDALIQFQQDMGLPATGVADKRTWDLLFSEFLKATDTERNSEGLFLFPKDPPDYAVSPGDALLLVSMIQLLLLELRATYDIFEDIVESGIYDENTEKAIREFQRINLLPETGKVDEATWNRIVREYSNIDAGVQ
ncbi:MAG: peptidoglycan-binding protein [Clostridia bacterium]|nr:peptidoglycan-binding protein [Clostridia bacterium]